MVRGTIRPRGQEHQIPGIGFRGCAAANRVLKFGFSKCGLDPPSIGDFPFHGAAHSFEEREHFRLVQALDRKQAPLHCDCGGLRLSGHIRVGGRLQTSRVPVCHAARSFRFLRTIALCLAERKKIPRRRRQWACAVDVGTGLIDTASTRWCGAHSLLTGTPLGWNTSRTDRSHTSGEYLLRLSIAPSSQIMESSAKAGHFIMPLKDF